jgi:hypothetical protein
MTPEVTPMEWDVIKPEDLMEAKKHVQDEWSHTELPNGSYLFWRTNEAGGRTYYTDENHVETVVWDTCLCAPSTLLAALVQEERLQHEEAFAKGRGYRD